MREPTPDDAGEEYAVETIKLLREQQKVIMNKVGSGDDEVKISIVRHLQ